MFNDLPSACQPESGQNGSQSGQLKTTTWIGLPPLGFAQSSPVPQAPKPCLGTGTAVPRSFSPSVHFSLSPFQSSGVFSISFNLNSHKVKYISCIFDLLQHPHLSGLLYMYLKCQKNLEAVLQTCL